MKSGVTRAIGSMLVALFVVQIALSRPAVAAPGDLVADVVVPEPYPTNVAPSVAFDGRYLYNTEYGGSVLHRMDVPPAGSSGPATGHVSTPIEGAASGIMTLTYDAGRDRFWAIGGDGLQMYLLTKTGVATLVFTITEEDRPGFVPGPFPMETKVAYDRADDTLWYSPDGNARIFHYLTTPDATGTAQLAPTPWIDVSVAPNDMVAECGYSQSSGIAVGGANLFVSVAGCSYYFEYTKTGGKVGAYAYNTNAGTSTQDIECDDLSYGVGVLWIRDGYDGHIRAFEQPRAGACVFGGGAAAAPPSPTPTPVPTATPVPTPTPTPVPTPTPLLPLPVPTPPICVLPLGCR